MSSADSGIKISPNQKSGDMKTCQTEMKNYFDDVSEHKDALLNIILKELLRIDTSVRLVAGRQLCK